MTNAECLPIRRRTAGDPLAVNDGPGRITGKTLV
jgi:hypothetical protein